MARTKPDHDVTLTVEDSRTVADESTLQTGTPSESQRTNDQAAAEAIAVQRALDKAALDAQDPIIYRYNGNAATGERLLHVPLGDIRQSLWDELPEWSHNSVAASDLYTKVEAN